jgi:DNA-binding NarL/FixJ family response regulator
MPPELPAFLPACGKTSPPVPRLTSVAVVEDDQGLQKQMVELLGTASDIRCLGAFGSGEEALKRIPALKPDVVLMDIQLPGMSGIKCVVELKKAVPAARIIMVTIYEDSERIFKALKAGANGYLVKSCPPHQMLEAVRDAFGGGAPMSSHIASKVIEHFHLIGPAPEETQNLSPREQQVLGLLSAGFIYKEISDKLNIKVTTVRTYVENICQKLHVRNRVEAVARHRPEAN